VGTFFSNLVTFFIIVTTALTLHPDEAMSPGSKELALHLPP